MQQAEDAAQSEVNAVAYLGTHLFRALVELRLCRSLEDQPAYGELRAKLDRIIRARSRFFGSRLPDEGDEKKRTDDKIRRDRLDRMICHWRGLRDTKTGKHEIAPYYIDALQSARVTMFGEVLPDEAEEKKEAADEG